MKTIPIGSMASLLWSSASTYDYVYHIKGLCPEKQTQFVASQVTVSKPVKEIKEPAKPVGTKMKSPVTFILHHAYNHYDFIEGMSFDNYLNKIELYLPENLNAKIKVIGYTDIIASDASNYDFGEMRANFIKDYIQKYGIPGSSISTISKGESAPIANNTSKEGIKKNSITQIEIN